MKTITETELEEILRLHKLWIDGDLSGVRADLRGVNLSNANLSESDLSNANLSEADLSNTDLSEADLSEADLSYADLSNADLSNTDLGYANFINADLSGTNLTGVCMFNCTGDGVRIRTTKTERYIINHYDDRCQIGCKNHSIEEWSAFMDDEISAMDDGALEWWKEWREFVVTEKKAGEE